MMMRVCVTSIVGSLRNTRWNDRSIKRVIVEWKLRHSEEERNDGEVPRREQNFSIEDKHELNDRKFIVVFVLNDVALLNERKSFTRAIGGTCLDGRFCTSHVSLIDALKVHH